MDVASEYLSIMPSAQFPLSETVLAWLQLNAGWEADVDVGPMISREAKARAEKLIQKGVEQGAQVSSIPMRLIQSPHSVV